MLLLLIYDCVVDMEVSVIMERSIKYSLTLDYGYARQRIKMTESIYANQATTWKLYEGNCEYDPVMGCFPKNRF